VRESQSYVERAPRAELAGAVRTVWIQRTGQEPYVQRHLPTGGVEIHFPIGGRPQLLGPLTGPYVDVLPPFTTLVGVRFHPGTAPLLPAVLEDLVDERVGLAELWGRSADRLGERVAEETGPEAALDLLQAHLLRTFRRAGIADRLVTQAARLLMPWDPVDVHTIAAHLSISQSQLRRRCLHAVGLGPKALQRTLRFQAFLALAQAGVAPRGRGEESGLAAIAAEAGYADQAHLSRECLRLTGLSPRVLLHGSIDRCGCGHDHSASYKPFLATRTASRSAPKTLDSFKRGRSSRS
jgi:AraC-like DNA-binding protein